MLQEEAQYINASTSVGLGGSGIGGNGRVWTGSAYAAVQEM